MKFKEYLNLREDGYVSGMNRELFVNPENMKGNSYIASFITIGGNTYTKTPFTIVDFVKEGNKVTQVKIKLSTGPALYRRSYDISGDETERGDPANSDVHTISIDEFNKLITQGLSQPQQDPMGGMGGPPMGGMGGPPMGGM